MSLLQQQAADLFGEGDVDTKSQGQLCGELLVETERHRVREPRGGRETLAREMDTRFGGAEVHRTPQATSDPLEFSFAQFRVREWIARGPDGVRYAFIERVEPPLEGWPNLVRERTFSRG